VNAAHTGYTFNFARANGVMSYAGFGYGGEGLGGNWDRWMAGTAAPTAGPDATGVSQLYLYGNYYVRYSIARNRNFDPLTYDPDNFRERVLEVSNLMDATDPDLTAFFKRGGKLILREDISDTAQSPLTGLNYWDAVVAKMGRETVDSSSQPMWRRDYPTPRAASMPGRATHRAMAFRAGATCSPSSTTGWSGERNRPTSMR
jgi:Tannase and feruloyl esterase